MKKLALAFTIVFVFAAIAHAAVDSERILNPNTVQPELCMIEVDRQEGAGWELVELVDVESVNLLNDYHFTVSVTPNVDYMIGVTVNDLERVVCGPFVEKRSTSVCVR